MGINFGNLDTTVPTPTEVAPAPAGISLNLEKNTVLDLAKASPGLTEAILAAGWDVARAGTDVDLDISVFLLNAEGKITGLQDVVFYNNKTAPGVTLTGDNRTGAGEGDDEQIILKLNEVPSSIQRIVACVTIDQAVERRQTFGMVGNSYVRLVNKANDQELARFNLKGDYSTDTAIVFAELVRSGSDWAFHAIGEGKQGDLNVILSLYQ